MKSYIDDKDISIGRPKYILNSSLGDLNTNLDVVNYADTLNDTSTLIIRVIEQSSKERGMTAYPRDPCKETLKLYQENQYC